MSRRAAVHLLTLGAVAAAAVVAAPAAARAQETAATRVVIRDVGPGRAGRWLREALSGPHVLLRSDSLDPIVLGRDTSYATTVVVVGGPAKIAADVRGDVFVVGGDLFLRPGVDIQGRAVAIGGGVYRTTLGRVGGGLYANRDFTYRVSPLPDGTLALDYQPLEVRDVRVLSLPGFFGIRLPTYDRTNGLSLPVGPTFSFDTGRVEVDALGIYRSQLGELDPRLELRASLGRRLSLTARAGRVTATNERWIRGDIPNSIVALFAGVDTRNYYRANRADALASYAWEGATTGFTVSGGALVEHGRSTRPDSGARGGPWSLFGRGDAEEGMLRPNPRVRHGRIVSMLGGAAMDYADEGVSAALSANAEVPVDAVGGGGWVQTTVDGTIGFRTFRNHRLEIETHALVTSGGGAPPQRYSWLGGSGTLPTFRLLEFGGDQLFFAEGRYAIPIERVRIRVLGSPTVTLRYMVGGAGIERLPALEQNVGLRIGLSLLRFDFVVDPASGDSDTSFGLSVFR